MARSKARKAVPRWLHDEVLARSEGRCEACVSVKCRGFWVHLHHTIEVRNGGLNEARNLLGVCDECHRTLHNQPLRRARPSMVEPATEQDFAWAIEKYGQEGATGELP